MHDANMKGRKQNAVLQKADNKWYAVALNVLAGLDAGAFALQHKVLLFFRWHTAILYALIIPCWSERIGTIEKD